MEEGLAGSSLGIRFRMVSKITNSKFPISGKGIHENNLKMVKKLVKPARGITFIIKNL